MSACNLAAEVPPKVTDKRVLKAVLEQLKTKVGHKTKTRSTYQLWMHNYGAHNISKLNHVCFYLILINL